jgi:O-antigen ligase
MTVTERPILVVVIAALTTAAMARPERALAQIWEIAALGMCVLMCVKPPEPLRIGPVSLCLFGAAAWGAVQWGAGWTVSPEATAKAVAQWTAMGALVLVGENMLAHSEARSRFLTGAAVAGIVAAGVSLALPHVTGIGYEELAGPFQNRNTYCSFVELLLPVVVWRASKDRTREWAWWTAAAGMAASVIATGSRAGGALVTAEFGMLLLVSARTRRIALAGGVACLAWMAAAGWETLAWRIRLDDPMRYRGEMISSAVNMAREKPWTGFGLGAFQDAYPPFATFDVGRIVNHAHNDWAEWGAEGGIVLPLLLLVPWIAAARSRHVWALGAVVVLVHSLFDYPMQRAGMAVWVWLVLAAAIASGARHGEGRRSDDGNRQAMLTRRDARRARPWSREPVHPMGRSSATAER